MTASPLHLLTINNNQLNLVAMQCLPFFVLALLHLDGLPKAGSLWAVPRTEWRAVGGMVAATTFVMLTDWYWVLLCAVFGLIWLATGLFYPGRLILLRRYLLAGSATLLVLAPLLAGILVVRHDLPKIDAVNDPVWQNYIVGFSADAFGLFLPPPFHPILDRLAPFGREGFGTEGWYVGAGWSLLFLAALGLAAAWRTHWRMVSAGIGCWVLSLGPSLWLAGHNTAIPLPYAWLQNMPLIGVGRRPALFAVMLLVLASLFAALGLQAVLRRWGPRVVLALLFPSLAFLLFEAWPPPRIIYAFNPPAVYKTLADRPGAVADLPISWRFEHARTLRHQLAHQQPILDGYVARWPRKLPVETNPWLYQLGTMALLADNDIVALDRSSLQAMQCATPVRHVVIDTTLAQAEELRRIEQLLARFLGEPATPTYRDATHVAYELPIDGVKCDPFLMLPVDAEGWYMVEQDAAGRRWRWSSGQSALLFTNPYATPQTVLLRMSVMAYTSARPLELWINGEAVSRWSVAPWWRREQVVLRLAPGQTRLEFVAPADSEGVPASERTLSVAFSALQVEFLR
ncbi:MAG: hypothetical protein EI684_19455 [Candidatus Viridilinea halotolerans]|uniref:Uncharacterized protein n=1 Tax=Candidatus Viridilinea halotolerans TaxID=2491704 RepID=A0A426TSP9_9CHLR|nr:MAG: hypothetical protein EI684_19455 [Candidatus Viridilinea halotolerans]